MGNPIDGIHNMIGIGGSTACGAIYCVCQAILSIIIVLMNDEPRDALRR